VTSEPATQPDRLGEHLRQARLAAGLSLSDLASLTHVRSVYLAALEEGHYEQLPEDVYSRNFVRLYALHVGLSVEPILERYQRERRQALGTDTLDQRLEQDRATVAALRRRGPAVVAPTPAAPQRTASWRQWAAHPWVLAGVLGVTLVALAGWGLQSLLGNGAQEPLASAGATAGGATGAPTSEPATSDLPPALNDPEAGAAAPTAADPLANVGEVSVVLVDILSSPEGATVTVDGFVLPGVTPLTGVPLTPRAGRVLAVELPGYQGLQTTLDLLEDRRVTFTLAPEPTSAGVEPANNDEIIFTITEASWFEVWQSTSRNRGERLAFTTAQPGAEFRFTLPVYVHVGNAAGVRVNLAGQDLGPLGGPGAVLGRPFEN